MFIREDIYGDDFSNYFVDVQYFKEEVIRTIKDHRKKPDYYTSTWLNNAHEAVNEHLERIFASYDEWLKDAGQKDVEDLAELVSIAFILHDLLTQN